MLPSESVLGADDCAVTELDIDATSRPRRSPRVGKARSQLLQDLFAFSFGEKCLGLSSVLKVESSLEDN